MSDKTNGGSYDLADLTIEPWEGGGSELVENAVITINGEDKKLVDAGELLYKHYYSKGI